MWRIIFSNFINFIIPSRGTERTVAATSLEELLALKISSSHTYGASLPYHTKEVTALVWELKYYANAHATRLGGASLEEELLSIASEEVGVPLLIPIPMHKKRRRSRGHNQTEVLCKAALRNMKDTFTYAPHTLLRIRHTRPQQGLQKEARLKNVENSMEVSAPSVVKGRTCVVVDDVATTGATLHEAQRALLEAGAEKVYCVALAVSV